MFSHKFSSIINEHPLQADALERVAHYFQRAEEEHKNIARIKLDSSRLKEITETDQATLADIISVLVSSHVLERKISLESPLGGGIAEYTSFGDIPAKIRDIKQDVVIDVTPALVKVFYKPVL